MGFVGEFGRVRFSRFANPSVDFFSFDFLLAGPERRLSFDHLVDQTTQAEKIRTESVPLVIYHFGGHVADSAYSSTDHLPLRNFDCQTQIGYSDVAVIVQ